MRTRARAALVAFSLIALASCREWDAPPAVAEDQIVTAAAITSLADCEALVTTGNGVSGTELYRYNRCRFDRLEELLGSGPGEPSPSPTSSPTPTATPSATAAPTSSPTSSPTAGTSVLNLPKEPNQPAGDFYAQFPKAKAAGWGKDFIPISVFLSKPSHVTQLKALGINTYMGAEHDGSPISTITSQGVYVLPHDEWTAAEVGNDSRAVGWHISDECDMGLGGCGGGDEYTGLAKQKEFVAARAKLNDGRFMQANHGNGVLRTFWSPNVMDDLVQLMDSTAVDKYAYTSPHVQGLILASPDWPSGVTPKRAAAYGWLQDQMESFQDPANPIPNWVFVETARPFLTESGSGTITPDQLEGAVWSSIVHGARGLAYFQHNNNGCGTYSLVDVGCPQATKDRVKAVNAKVQSLASVINSDTYVWDYRAGVDTMTKQVDGSLYVFAAPGLKSTTGAKTFTLPAGVNGTQVEVVGENRTLPVSGGKFSDTFAAESSHHVYRVRL